LLFLSLFLLSSAARGEELTARSYLLMEASSGQVLLSKDPDLPLPPASTTKILTALVAIKRGNLDEEVVVSEKASRMEGSRVYLEPGERRTMRELLYALMLQSGNDAAVAIAEHIAGTEEEFARLMEEEARSLGARSSTFRNPHGLHHPGHLVTARDLALTTREALKWKEFREIVATRERVIPGPRGERHLWNKNRLLWEYPGAIGVKTGYTPEAGSCLVAAAEREGRLLIAVVLGSRPGASFREAAWLLDQGFENFREERGVQVGEEVARLRVQGQSLPLLAGESFSYAVPRQSSPLSRRLSLERRIEPPLGAGEEVASLEFYHGEERVGSVKLISGAALDPPRRPLAWLAPAFFLFAVLLIRGRRRRKAFAFRPSGELLFRAPNRGDLPFRRNLPG
jgi:D-alanyl-D-alanine carboxypeptidase (penicillin-binding protein 5/6)